MPTLANALLEALKDHGAREIFGIPGDFVLPLFKVIEESNILPSFTLSHEPGVGFAADATARYHGGLGVAVVTPETVNRPFACPIRGQRSVDHIVEGRFSPFFRPAPRPTPNPRPIRQVARPAL